MSVAFVEDILIRFGAGSVETMLVIETTSGVTQIALTFTHVVGTDGAYCGFHSIRLPAP